MEPAIYFDYNATTPVDERVLERMWPYFREQYGNASSAGHTYGWAAEEAVEHAREQVAALIGSDPRSITFTSGATEALNTALKGVAQAYRSKGQHIVTVQTEHRAVLDTCAALEREGTEVTYLPVQPNGQVDPDDVAAALRDDTILVAVMWANNETGVIHPVAEITERARKRDVLVLTDATQALGKVPVQAQHADLLVGSAHKLYGPKGIGMLYASRRRPRVRIAPLIHGGGQEHGLRGGTLNVPAIAGFGMAAELARQELLSDARRMEQLRDRFEQSLIDALPDIRINGQDAPRLPQTSSVTFTDVSAEHLVLALRSVACSTGSACSSGSNKPSHVLKAHGLSDAEARATVRFSLGRFTTPDEIERATRVVVEAVRNLRSSQPAPQAR